MRSPKSPPPAPPPVSATSAEIARSNLDAQRRRKRQYSFDDTLLAGRKSATAPGPTLSPVPPGNRSTLG